MKPKHQLVTRIVVDRAWGRYTCNWCGGQFPQLRGKVLEFASDRDVEVAPEVYLWLQVNRFLR